MNLNEKTYIEINGIQQGMILQSENIDNPVLLFLHGGPGSPEIAFTQEYPTGFEKMFTVCWWEQRGSGMSYNKNISKETMTIEQLISDAIAVTNYLLKRFNKQKIYVMGHSWGTFLGVLTAQRAPELFYAYIGAGQTAQQLKSEQLAYTYMLSEFRSEGNKRMVKKLEKFPIDKGTYPSVKYLNIQGEAMTKLGIGAIRKVTSSLGFFNIVRRYKGYSQKEKMNLIKGGKFSAECFWDLVLQSDLIKQVPKLEIPIYVMQGRYDYTTSYVIAKEFMQAIAAPVKGFYTFENSAHSPFFEEPDKMCEILCSDVLQGKCGLADTLNN